MPRIKAVAVLLLIASGVGFYWTKRNLKPRPSPPTPQVNAAARAPDKTAGFQAPDLAMAALSELDREAMQAVHSHFATGDFLTALKLADSETLDPRYSQAFQTWLTEQMPAILTSAGWIKLKLGDCETAIAYFRRSAALRKTPETAKGLAVCHYKQKNLSAAGEEFTYYLGQADGQNDIEMQILYTDVLESDGLYEEAVKRLEPLTEGTKAQTLDPTLVEQLKNRLASMRARLKESGLQLRDSSRNFRISYRAGEHEELVNSVLQTLEDAFDEYVDNFGFKAPSGSIEVLLYPARDFRNLVVGGPEWAEGIFDGRLRIPVKTAGLQQADQWLRIVLRHELVHALFSNMNDSRSLPSWFDEGMAQFLSCRPNCTAFRFSPTPGEFLGTSAFSTPYVSFDAVKAGRAYQQSLYLVNILNQRYGEDGLKKLVNSMTTSSALDSDTLLSPLNLSFQDLHGIGQEAWKARQ